MARKSNLDNPLWLATIYGQPVSKSNSSNFSYNHGRPVLRKSERARNYINTFEAQIIQRHLAPKIPLEVVCSLVAKLFYKDQRSDLDDSQICDCLQKSGVIKNDRQIREKHLYHGIDKENPRTEIALYAAR